MCTTNDPTVVGMLSYGFMFVRMKRFEEDQFVRFEDNETAEVRQEQVDKLSFVSVWSCEGVVKTTLGQLRPPEYDTAAGRISPGDW